MTLHLRCPVVGSASKVTSGSTLVLAEARRRAATSIVLQSSIVGSEEICLLLVLAQIALVEALLQESLKGRNW